jgi:hypothetical protein
MSKSLEELAQVVKDPKRARVLERHLAIYVASAAVMPLSAGLKESPLVTWVETDDTDLAIAAPDQFKNFQIAQGKPQRRAGNNANRILRALNPASATKLWLQQRQESGEYVAAPISDYGYAEDGVARGIIVDSLPMLVSGLKAGELRIGKACEEVVQDLGAYCLALFADRQPVSLASAV